MTKNREFERIKKGFKGFLIGTHNSATGESGKGVLSWLLTPFARCQSRSIRSQWEAGCRYYDIRLTLCRDGVWRAAHGLWTSKRTIRDIIDEINTYAWAEDDSVFVSLTLERGDKTLCDMIWLEANKLMEKYGNHVLFTYVAYKRPKWTMYHKWRDVPIKQGYTNIDGSSWHTYIPIPWLWKKIYHNHTDYDRESFTMVDFL